MSINPTSTLATTSVSFHLQGLSGDWTQVKVQKVFCRTIASLSLVSAGVITYAAASFSCVPIASVIPLILISGALFWYATTLIDYEDAKVLSSLREKARHTPFADLVEKHSFEKIFQYQILSPEFFEISYRSEACRLSFPNILDLYKKATMALLLTGKSDAFKIPHPKEWKEKFDTETKHWRCDKILDHYSLDDLKSYELISSKQLEILKKVLEEKNKLRHSRNALEKQYLDRTCQENFLFQNAKEMAELSYQSHLSHSLLMQLVVDTDFAIAACRENAALNIRDEEASFRKFKEQLLSSKRGLELNPEDLRSLKAREELKKERIKKILENERLVVRDIRDRMEWKKAPLEHSLMVARQLRDFSIQQAQNRFHLTTSPIRREIDAEQAELTRKFHDTIEILTKSYRS